MKSIKLYNVIFPIWFILFFPPFVLVTLLGNFIIDSIVVIVCFYAFRLKQSDYNLKDFYKKSIWKVWIFGFMADLIGASVLLLFGIMGDYIGIPYEVTSAINFNAFKHPVAVIIILFATILSSVFIFLFDNKISFRDAIKDKSLRLKLSLTVAIVTAPWTFIIPTQWFYHGL